MGKVSRLFATEEMKLAAKEFKIGVRVQEYLHPICDDVDEDKLLEDYFLAGAIWYKMTH